MARLFGKLFSRKDEAPVAPAPTADHCPHATLSPRWDDPADMGKEEKASAFVCSACSSTFSPEEARELRATEAERLRESAMGACSHPELTPQWNEPGDEGDEEKVSGFVCSVCHAPFTPAEAQARQSTG